MNAVVSFPRTMIGHRAVTVPGMQFQIEHGGVNGIGVSVHRLHKKETTVLFEETATLVVSSVTPSSSRQTRPDALLAWLVPCWETLARQRALAFPADPGERHGLRALGRSPGPARGNACRLPPGIALSIRDHGQRGGRSELLGQAETPLVRSWVLKPRRTLPRPISPFMRGSLIRTCSRKPWIRRKLRTRRLLPRFAPTSGGSPLLRPRPIRSNWTPPETRLDYLLQGPQARQRVQSRFIYPSEA